MSKANLALANTCNYSNSPVMERMELAEEITSDLIEETSRLYILASAAENSVSNKDKEPEVIRLLEVLEERIAETTPRLYKLRRCISEEIESMR